jgi:hypothetical protein
MKIFYLLTFFSIALAPVASAKQKDQDRDQVRSDKNRPQVAQKPRRAPNVAPPRHVQQGPKIQRSLPPTPANPRIRHTQPRINPPVTTVQRNRNIQREDWQDQPRVRRNQTYTPAPRLTPTVKADTDRRIRNRDGQDLNRDWRNRHSNNNSWENARRRHHRQHRHRDWWRSHYTRFALFGAGYYFWDNGYWFPAYGYDPSYNTYSYNDLEPGQVIASVQTELQRLGYYRYAVDGQMGPMTRAAIADYQRDNGLAITSAIDEPTLQTLGLS